MSRFRREILLCLVAIGGLAACNDGPTAPRTRTEVASIEVSPVSISVPEGETVPFHAVARNAQGEEIQVPATEIRWHSSDSLIAEVDTNGIAITRTKSGTARIVAEIGGKQGSGALTPQARCASPAPVEGTGYALVPSMIVAFQGGVDRKALSQKLAQKYGFAIVHLFEFAPLGFSANLPYTTIAQLRCEAGVAYLTFDGFVYPDN